MPFEDCDLKFEILASIRPSDYGTGGTISRS